MPINYTDAPESSDKVNSCLGCFLILLTATVAIIAVIPVKGFWPCTGIFFTVFTGGLLGGITGCAVGNSICNFTRPKIIGTSGNLGDIAMIKIFWLIIPQLTGILLGWVLGIHFMLTIFWKIPITALGQDLYVSEKKPESLGEKFSKIKNDAEFIEVMSNADQKTKVDALLMVGIDAGSVVTVNEALRLGADVNTPRLLMDKNGVPHKGYPVMAPLFAALTTRFANGSEIAMILLKHGAEVNITDKSLKNLTPLLYVLRENRYEMIIPLIEYGADLNAVDFDGKTPLHHAMNYDYEKIIHIMLRKNAPLNVKDRWGNTSLDYASPRIKLQIRYKKETVLPEKYCSK